MEARVKTGLLMNFDVTNLKSEIKRFILLRVLRGETILYLCESLGASPFLFSYPLETTKSCVLQHCHPSGHSSGA